MDMPMPWLLIFEQARSSADAFPLGHGVEFSHYQLVK
ncbi:MAG: hypothetical protein RL741_752 [Actinomycetota bacterium]|jgi:hypothetical protein